MKRMVCFEPLNIDNDYFGTRLSGAAKDLIRGLLEKDPD